MAPTTTASPEAEGDDPAAARRTRYIGWALLFLAGVCVGLLGVFGRPNYFDEPLILVGAQRILSGELPFRDFYTSTYPPGQYYVVAALCGVFGDSIPTLRVYGVVVRAALALLLYLTARRVAGRSVALACWGACVLWVMHLGFYGYPTFPALLLIVLAWSILASCLDRSRPGIRSREWRLFIAGGALGAAALFRHDVAFLGLLAAGPHLAALARKAAKGHASGGTGMWISVARGTWPFAAGVAGVFGLPALVLLAVVPLQDVVFPLLTYPAESYALVRGLPFPPLLRYPLTPQVLTDPLALLRNLAYVPFYAPALFYALGLIWVAARVLSRRQIRFDPAELTVVGLVLFGGLSYVGWSVRSDVIHGVTTLLPAYVVAAALMQSALVGCRRWRAGAVALATLCLLSLMWPVRYFPLDWLEPVYAALSPAETVSRTKSPYERAAAFLRRVVPPEGRIFVGCARHDKVFMNEPLVYVLADRLPGTKYHVLDPGVATTLAVQRRIVQDLVRNRVEYLVLSDAFAQFEEPNMSSVSSGVTYLDEYLRSHYRVLRRFGGGVSVWRRSAPHPSS